MHKSNIHDWLNSSTTSYNYSSRKTLLDLFIQNTVCIWLLLTCLLCFANIYSNKHKCLDKQVSLNKWQLKKTQMTKYIETLIEQNVTISCQQKNPKRPNTLSNIRYEKYKTATTLKKVIELGGSKRDIAWDIEKSYMAFEDKSHYNEFVKIMNKSK